VPVKDSGTLIIGILFLAIALLMYINPEFRTLSKFSSSSPSSLQVRENPIHLCVLMLSISVYFIYQSFKK
jgi:hypothetical protein